MPDFDRTIMHLDMDAFFASVEVHDNPELRGKPVIVGSPPDQRGVVSTCSYEARKFGVHSAMPSSIAGRLCPQGIFLPVRMARYAEVSRRVFEILGEFSPFVEPLSIDEAFLDITGSMHLFGGAEATGREVRARIQATTGLTGSVGLAPNKFLAKLASDMDKPDGLTIAPRDPEAIMAFLAPLPLRRIWGVGAKTEERLKRLGLKSVADVQRLSRETLIQLVGGETATRLWDLCRGLDTRDVQTEREEKSISAEHTFGEDCRDWTEVERVLLDATATVGPRLRAAGRLARTAHIKLRWENFETLTRQITFPRPTHTDRDLRDAALMLLSRERRGRAVRLVGFGVSGFVETGGADDLYQPDLFAAAGAAPGTTPAATPNPVSQGLGRLSGSKGAKKPTKAGARRVDQTAKPDDFGSANVASQNPVVPPPPVDPAKEERLDEALDRLRGKFGKGVIRRGT